MEKEAKAWSTIWSAGQGVTNISDNPTVKDLVDLMKKEFKAAIEAQQVLLEKIQVNDQPINITTAIPTKKPICRRFNSNCFCGDLKIISRNNLKEKRSN